MASRQRTANIGTAVAAIGVAALVAAGCGAAAPAAGLRAARDQAATGGSQVLSAPDSGAAAGAGPVGGAAQRAQSPAAESKAAAPGGAASGASQPALPPLPATDRMVIKTSTLTVQVADLTEAVQRVNAVVAGIPGAYVAASSTSYRADAPAVGAKPVTEGSAVVPPPGKPAPGQSASVTLKVPADSFGEAMQRLREVGTPVLESVSTQEVTEEFVDLDAQVRNLEATEQQYLRLMDRAQKIEEILPLQQRVTEVRGQIERLRGRMNLLQRRSDLSTITVSLVLPGATSKGTAALPRPIRTLQEAWSGMGVFLQGLLDVLIYLGVYALPFVPAAGLYLWWRRRRRPVAGVPGAI